MALVNWARSSTEYLSTSAALALWGGSPNLTGQTVLIKPNVVCTNPSPYATHAEVVHAIIHWCLSRGALAEDITIADRSDPGWDTDAAMSASGIATIITDNGCNYINFDDDTFTTVTPAEANHWTDGIEVANSVLATDYLIDVPVAKNHLFSCNYTAAIKNWMGIISQSNTKGRIFAHGSDPEHSTDLHHRLPQIWYAAPADLIVLDCTHICLTEGPFGIGEESDPMIVAVTTDPVAADATAMSILKHRLIVEGVSQPQFDGNLWLQGVIAQAAGNIGITGASQYTYSNNGVTEIADYLALLGVSENPTSIGWRKSASDHAVDGTFYPVRKIQFS